MHWRAKQTGRFKSGKESYVNHLTTNDDYRIVGAICFEDTFCASRKGGTKEGRWVSPEG